MDWWGYVASGIGVIGGIYGAYRAWRTDRSLKLLGKKWEIQIYDAHSCLLINRQPRTVLDVRLAFAGARVIHQWPVAPVTLKPNEEVKFVTMLPYSATDSPGVVTWRTVRSSKVRTWRGYVPAKE